MHQHVIFRHILPFPSSLAFQLLHVFPHEGSQAPPARVNTAFQLPDSRESYCTPRSPVEKMSILFSPKQANISTDHFPKPLTAVNFSRTSSSLAFMSIAALSSPEANFSASPLIYSAFRSERPAWRKKGTLHCATSVGVGNDASSFCAFSGVGTSFSRSADLLKSSTNFLLIDEAAAPDTYRNVRSGRQRIAPSQYLLAHYCTAKALEWIAFLT